MNQRNYRAERLRTALQQEWRRAQIEYANCEKPSIRAIELEAHIAVMAAVLRKDAELEAQEQAQ